MPYYCVMDAQPANIVLRMRRLLDGDIAVPQWPADVSITGFVPEQAKEAYTIMLQGYTNGYNYLPVFVVVEEIRV